MVLHTFAALKDIFSATFEIPHFEGKVQDLRELLIKQFPDAKNLLTISRFAVGSNILNDENTVSNSDTIYIIPPSSGG